MLQAQVADTVRARDGFGRAVRSGNGQHLLTIHSSRTCFVTSKAWHKKACHAFAFTTQVGLIQTLGAMGSSPEVNQVYAPPKARLANDPRGKSTKLRFWLTCLLCAFLLPFLVFLWLDISEVSDLAAVALFLSAWLLPTGFILWPQIGRPGGFSEMSLQRLVTVSTGFVICTVVFSFVMWVLLSTVYVLIKRLV